MRRLLITVVGSTLPALLCVSASAQEVLHVHDGMAQGEMQRVHSAGDVDLDGYADIIRTGKSSTVVLSGKTQATLRNLGSAGYKAIGIGDANGDGVPDLLTGLASSPYQVVSGATLATISAIAHGGSTTGGVRATGDVDGDGHGDVILGSPELNRAFVYSGNTGALIHQFSGIVTPFGNPFALYVAPAGDVNADGFMDVLATSDWDAHYTIVFSGFSGKTLHYIPHGHSGCGVGDLDQDGFDDFVVPWGNNLDAYSGQMGVAIHGLSFGVSSGVEPLSLDALGDVSGDGIPDVLVGAHAPSIGSKTSVHVFSGSDARELIELIEPQTGSSFGFPVVGLGDVNLDGVPDFGVSAPTYDGAFNNQGQATVYSGHPCGKVEAYGSGCAGSGGFTPAVSITGCLSPTDMADFELTGGLGGSTAWIFFGVTRGSTPMAPGCTLNVSPLLPVAFALPLGGAGPGGGTSTLTVSLTSPVAAGTFTLQAFVIDAGVAHGYANSNGLEVTLRP